MTNIWQPLHEYKLSPRGAGIYVIRCKVNKKEYVGKSYDVRNRLRQHIRLRSNQRLHKAIVQHGISTFEFLVLHIGALREELSALEISEIATRKTYGLGYNDTRGGDGNTGRKHTEASLAKMRARVGKVTKGHTGFVHSAEARARIGAFNKNRLISPETREKIRAAQLAKYTERPGEGHRPVLVWRPEALLPLEFTSAGEASVWAGVSRRSIGNWIERESIKTRKRMNPAATYVWAFAD